MPTRVFFYSAFFLATVILTPFSYAQKEVAEDFYKYASSNGLLEHGFDDVLESTLSLIAADTKTKFAINQPYAEGKLNLYVVSHQKANGIAPPILGKTLKLIQISKLNVIAMPPDVIICDARYLAALINNTWLGSIFHLQAQIQAVQAPETFLDISKTFNHVGQVARLAHFSRDSLENTDVEAATLITEGYRRGGTPEIFQFALAPVLLHEIGHLEKGSSGFFWSYLQDFIDELQRLRIRREEDLADAYATERLTNLLAKQNEQQWPVSVLGLTSTISYLRDVVLGDVFTGIRGRNAADFLTRWSFRDCESPLPPALITSDLKKGMDAMLGQSLANFLDVRLIDYVDWDEFPLLSQAEMQTVEQRIFQRVSNRTHAHHFARSTRLFNAIIVNSQAVDGYKSMAETFMSTASSLLAAIDSKDYAAMNSHKKRIGMGVTLPHVQAELQTRLKQDIVFLPAVNCPVDQCVIGQLENDGGTVEVTGPQDSVTRITALLPLFTQKDGESDIIRSVNAAVVIFVTLDLLLAEDAALPEGTEKASEEIPLMLKWQTERCGRGSVGWSFTNASVLLFTVNEDGWVKLIVEGVTPPVSE